MFFAVSLYFPSFALFAGMSSSLATLLAPDTFTFPEVFKSLPLNCQVHSGAGCLRHACSLQ